MSLFAEVEPVVVVEVEEEEVEPVVVVAEEVEPVMDDFQR